MRISEENPNDKGNVGIGGDVNKSVILTGNNNTVYIGDKDSEALSQPTNELTRTKPKEKTLQPHFVHPYPLQKNFTGRVRERSMLTRWLLNEDSPIFTLIAIGGMGKSALTWAWVQRDVLGDVLPGSVPDDQAISYKCRVPEHNRPLGIFWWSFYERDASFSSFVRKCLLYCSNQQFNLRALPSTEEQVQALISLLRDNSFLLVLDGFERELLAYSKLSSVYQGDLIVEDKKGKFRSTTHPQAKSFLQAIGSQAIKSHILITSRLHPLELDDLAGCERQELTSLDPSDAIAFFEAQGIKGSRLEIETACRPYGNHPLSLRLLAGVILKDKHTPGLVKVANNYEIIPKLKGKEQHHILQVAYENLAIEKQKLLSQIAAFRVPMDYRALEILNPYETRQAFDECLDEFIERGLLFQYRLEGHSKAIYDLHPIVRAYTYHRLTDKKGIHSKIIDYYGTIPNEDHIKAESLDDLSPIIELYHHTVQAGFFDKAADLYYEKLSKTLFYRFAAYHICLSLL